MRRLLCFSLFSGFYFLSLTATAATPANNRLRQHQSGDSLDFAGFAEDEPQFSFFIPNAFSPNGDGINDTFFGKGENVSTFEMIIYDRFGKLVFYADNINKHWDGRLNHSSETAPQDVYVYVIRLTDMKDRKYKYIGTVTLVK